MLINHYFGEERVLDAAPSLDRKKYKHEMLFMASCGPYCFIAETDRHGYPVPDRWLLPGNPLLMTMTCATDGTSLRTFGKLRVVDTDWIRQFAERERLALHIGDYPISRADNRPEIDEAVYE